MIPVLYDKTETAYTTNGIGRLSGAVSCLVTEERNGVFALEMVYPSSGEHYADITPGMQVLASVGKGRQTQPFEITKVTRPISGKVTVEAEHKSYQMELIPVGPCEAESATEALAALKAAAAESCPFTFWTNKVTIASFAHTAPGSLRSRLGGEAGSVLDVFGGEWEFDRFTCRLWSSRGEDRGVVLRYGKNITDINQEESIQNTITGVYPYYQSETAYVELTEKVLHSEHADEFPYQRTMVLDLSSEFDATPTEAQLRTAAESYMSRHSIGVPKVNLKVSFVDLAQTEEYKDVAPLEEVRLCDTVGVYFEPLGVEAKAKVVRTVWNALEDRYDSVEIGEVRANMARTIAAIEKETIQAVDRSALSNAFKVLTDAITGASGGVIRFNYNSDGQPYELLILDTGNIDTAVNVWRWNSGGFGHSSTGYNGEYTVGITQDGQIVADMITTGILQGIQIIAESGSIGGWTISADGLYKVFGNGNYRIILKPSTAYADPFLACQYLENGTWKNSMGITGGGSAYFGNDDMNGTLYLDNQYGFTFSRPGYGEVTIRLESESSGGFEINLTDSNNYYAAYITRDRIGVNYTEGSTTTFAQLDSAGVIRLKDASNAVSCTATQLKNLLS